MTSARDVYELSRAVLAEGNGDGWIAVLRVYMDESGTHDGSPVVAVGAYVALPRVWRDWTKVWNRRKRPIRIFHSNDCANFWGEFEGWDKERRDPFVAQLLPTIPEHQTAAFVAGIRMDDFREVCRSHPHLAKVIKTPYTACFQWVVQDILRFLNAHSDLQKLAIFHENNEYMAEATHCFDFVKRFDNRGRKMTLAFGSKEDYVPLQAADVLAYEGNKRFRNPTGPKRRAWTAINPKGTNRSSLYFDKAKLVEFAESVNGMGDAEMALRARIAAEIRPIFRQH